MSGRSESALGSNLVHPVLAVACRLVLVSMGSVAVLMTSDAFYIK